MTQQQALEICKQGHNVFLTGSAGSGKTHILSSLIQHYRVRNMVVGVTASTGVAATHLGGMTINAWSGVGVRRELSDADVVQLLKRKYLHRRFRSTKVLIIDEVSMLPADTLEMVDKLIRAFRRSDEPFGGIQVILCGDFFQLPPVETAAITPSFLFKSRLWQDLDLKICYLEKPFRQSDERFLRLLEEIRTNNITQSTWSILKERFLMPVDKEVTPARLYTHNGRADMINVEELTRLSGPTHVYHMQTEGDDNYITLLKKSCLAPEQLILKPGALVMFVKNKKEEGYVNGTMGKIVDFTDEGTPIVETFSGKIVKALVSDWVIEEDGEIKATVSQVPLRLAWAITIHKSQGMTLDAAEIDLGKSFVTGLGYVALSRVRTLEGIKLRSLNRTALRVDEEVIQYDKKFKEASKSLVNELRNDYWYQKNLKDLGEN